ncbi:MAG: hypothetical protein FWD90_02045 [Defluviitaleaceae bacterium]|nr:hypothetical protein [Defluviitaleaceae bacterium]
MTPTRIEVAFISYKAAMSDALETIYLAAKDDPDCDAYWIPVPYYGKNTDGTHGEMHYEGADCYGPQFEITDWQMYDMEARRPDVVFTFYPYDNHNVATSIHPDYYCERMHSLTDTLVYVPYFVVENAADISLKNSPVFINVALRYASYIIVQSEKEKQEVIRLYRKFKEANPNTVNVGNLDKKLLPLGSPKLDKNFPSFPVPDEWTRIINNRKVIFYNTGHRNENVSEYLKKLRSVLAFFRTRTDIALLWRPHPLTGILYKSRLPERYAEYMQIVNEYKSQSWGIYDDTPDLHRAIALSDTYYGCDSSVVSLYKQTGKLIMLENIHIKNGFGDKRINNILRFSGIYDDGNHYWVSASGFNALFKIDRTTLAAKYMGSFPGAPVYDSSLNVLYNAVNEYKGKLYFAPVTASQIGVYDLNDGSFSTLPLKIAYNRINNPLFTCILTVDNGLFFIPNSYPAIVFYDVYINELKYYDDWLEALNKLCRPNVKNKITSMRYFTPTAALSPDNETIILPCGNTGAVAVFDIKSGTSRIYSKHQQNGYCGVVRAVNDYWLIKVNGDIEITNDPEGKIRETIHLPADDEVKNGQYRFTSIFYFNGNVWLLPNGGRDTYKINCITKEITRLDSLICGTHIEPFNNFSYSRAVQRDGMVSTLSQKDGVFKQISTTGDIIHSAAIHISDEDMCCLKNKITKAINPPMYNECPIFTLDDFIYALTLLPKERLEVGNKNTIGFSIYDHIKTTSMKG